MKKITDIISAKPWVGWILYLLTIVVVFLIGVFGSSIIERRSEANLIVQNVKPIADWEPRNEVWGENYPREFETYKSTLDPDISTKEKAQQYIGPGFEEDGGG